MTRTLLAVAAVLVALVGIALPPAPKAGPAASEPQVQLAPPTAQPGFARALEARPFALPADHGPHFEYQTEWWYYTGNLTGTGGRRFAFQLTFFRRGLTPGPPDDTGLATNQIYLAHLGLLDVESGHHFGLERADRGAGGLAGAEAAPFRVWLEDWTAEATNDDGSAVRLRARDGRLGLDLRLQALKPLALHGDRGLSAKSAAPGNASYYVGYTRLAATGELAVDGAPVPVEGSAWFDHEWSTSALGPGAMGWDWFSLQLDDDRDLMYFQIRREDGSIEPVSGGTLVEADGTTRHLPADAVRLEVLDHWTSPSTKAVYPARWRLTLPELGLDLEVEPLLADQEMRVSVAYWEGAVSVSGTARRRPVRGHGFVELTGYARGVRGLF